MKLTRLAVTAVLAVTLSLVAVTAASAAKYPSGVRKAFVSQCFASAKAAARGGVPDRKLRKACRVSLRCIEKRLSVAEFQRASVRDRPIRRCVAKGAKAIS